LQAAVSDVCKNGGVLIVFSLSRLARSTRDCIELADRLERHDADLASISEKIDTTSSMGRFFFRLMASLGELERDQVSERTCTAMSHLRRRGSRISGHVPFGFDIAPDGQSLIANGVEQVVVRRIEVSRQLGNSFAAIADALNAEGVRPKAGVRWYASSVRSVLLSQQKRAG